MVNGSGFGFSTNVLYEFATFEKELEINGFFVMHFYFT